MKRSLPLFLLTICFLSGIRGQTVHEIREVKIYAEAETDALKLMEESGTSSMVVSSRELNNLGHNTAGDVLKRLPRIVVQGPPSFHRNIMMAGLDKEFQCVLIDGNRPGGGEDSRDFKLDRLPVSMIEKIEVINNPPASLGADATIGAVNITLKDAPEKRLLGTDLSLDRSSTHGRINPEGSISYGNRWDRWSLFLNGNINSFNRKNSATLSDTVLSGTETEDLDVLIAGVTGSVTFKPDSLISWSLRSAFTRYREELVFLSDINRRSQGGLSARADSADDSKKRILHSHTLGYTREKNGSRWKSDLSFSQHYDIKYKWRNREKSAAYETSLDDEHQRNSEVILRSDYERHSGTGILKHLLKTGVRISGLRRDFDRMVYTKVEDHMFWDFIEDGSYAVNEYRAGVYLADDAVMGRLWISPAIRMDVDWGDFNTSLSESGAINYLSLNPSVHTKYDLGSSYFLKADLARQIARPPFNLMVPVEKVKSKKKIIEKGNPDLIPSKAWNMGLGTEKYINDRGFVTLRGFYSILRDVVETLDIGIDDTYGYRVLQSVNVDSGKIWGVDLSTRYSLMKPGNQDLSFSGNLSWLGSEVRDPETGKLRRLSEQPEWIVNGSVDYLNTRLRIMVSVGVNHIGERVTPSSLGDGTISNDLVQSPFTQWDARIKYFFSSWGGIYLNCINLLGEKMEFSQGAVHEIHTVGRNFVVGISMNL